LESARIAESLLRKDKSFVAQMMAFGTRFAFMTPHTLGVCVNSGRRRSSYEVQARATHERTARLKALRIAKEAQEQNSKEDK
jgi:hypothetical protein